MWMLSVVSKCGWAFSSVTRPCVAQRVWPIPVSTACSATATAALAVIAASVVAIGDRHAERVEVADRADGIDPVSFEHRDPGAVISPVLELLEPFHQEGACLPRSDVTDDAAHVRVLLGVWLAPGEQRAV